MNLTNLKKFIRKLVHSVEKENKFSFSPSLPIIRLAKKKLKIDEFWGILILLILIFEWSQPHLIYAKSPLEERINVFRAENQNLSIILKNSTESQPKENLLTILIGEDKDVATVPEIKVKRVIKVTVTAYSSTPDQTDNTPFITASGSRVRDGIIAANFLRFGTKVRFPDYSGDKIFVVEDKMHPRFYHRVDIWMTERQLAKEFGVKRLEMEILEN
jgi:3D (Asp-Asp-Asp) domain-containing protein